MPEDVVFGRDESGENLRLNHFEVVDADDEPLGGFGCDFALLGANFDHGLIDGFQNAHEAPDHDVGRPDVDFEVAGPDSLTNLSVVT